MVIRGRHPLRRRHRRLPSAFGRRLSVGGRWEPRGHRPVFFLVFRLAFSTFLGLGLGLPSAFGVVEVEAGRVEVRRDGEGEVESRLALLKAPMLLSLFRRLGAGYMRFKGEATGLLPVVPRLPSPDRVGRHASVASCPSSSMVKSSVTVADSPRRRIRGQRPSSGGDAAERAGAVLLWCLGSGASSDFGGTSLSSFCVKGWSFFVASPTMVVEAVCFRPSGLTAADLAPQT
jgi:hypothetical protein